MMEPRTLLTVRVEGTQSINREATDLRLLPRSLRLPLAIRLARHRRELAICRTLKEDLGDVQAYQAHQELPDPLGHPDSQVMLVVVKRPHQHSRVSFGICDSSG